MSRKIYCKKCHYFAQGDFCFAPNIVRTFWGKTQENQFASSKNVNNDCVDFESDSRGWYDKWYDSIRWFDKEGDMY